MQKFPHYYHAKAMGQPTGILETHSGELTKLEIAAPREFNGPGDKWSPEELLVASAANCLILTFRAVANASNLEWSELSCEARGTLDMVERKTQFTALHIDISLEINSSDDTEKALKLLEKAENSCLITNSLTAETHLKANVTVSS